MPKRLLVIALIPVLLFVLVAAAPRTGSWTESNARYGDGWRITTLLGVSDSTGAFSSLTTSTVFRGIIRAVVTDPDTTLVPADADSTGQNPTDNYDITITNTDGLEIMGGALYNRDTSTTERAEPVFMSTGMADSLTTAIFNTSTLTVAVTNNLIPNARINIKIFWEQK